MRIAFLLVVSLLAAALTSACGSKSSGKSAAELAAILKDKGHDVRAEDLEIEQTFPDTLRSPEDKGTSYIVRVKGTEKATDIGPITVKIEPKTRFKIFIADSDGFINVSRT